MLAVSVISQLSRSCPATSSACLQGVEVASLLPSDCLGGTCCHNPLPFLPNSVCAQKLPSTKPVQAETPVWDLET